MNDGRITKKKQAIIVASKEITAPTVIYRPLIKLSFRFTKNV